MRLARHMLHALLLAALAIPATAAAEFYRWVDEDGQVHYSDSLPPERAPDSRREFSKRGDHLRDIDRAPTEDEIRAMEEARRQAEAARTEERERQRLQAEYDRMLSLTYTSVDELQRTRDERVERVQGLVDASIARQERYQQEIGRLEDQAARAERRGSGDAEEIYRRLENTRSRLANEHTYMQEQEGEIAAIREEFSAHISRFRELKGER